MPARKGVQPTQQAADLRVSRRKKVSTQVGRYGKLKDASLHEGTKLKDGTLHKITKLPASHHSKGGRRVSIAQYKVPKSEQRGTGGMHYTFRIGDGKDTTISVFADGKDVTSKSDNVETYTTRLVGFLIGLVKDKLGSIDAADIDLYSIGSPEDVAESMAAVLPASHPFDDVIGPFYDSSGVARRLQVTTGTVQHRARQHQLLACPTAEGILVYPTWQFGTDGSPLPGLDRVLETMSEGTNDRWQVALWLRTASAQLKGETPHDALASGRTKSVELLAEQTAARWQQ